MKLPLWAKSLSEEKRAAIRLRDAAQRFGRLGEPLGTHDSEGAAANRQLLKAAIAYAKSVSCDGRR